MLNRGISHRRWAGFVLALAVLASSGAAHAVTITLTAVPPTPGTLTLGSPVRVDIVASGLVAGDAPSLTSFEIGLSFDDAVLDLLSVTFNPLLGTTCTLETLDASCQALAETSSSTGSVQLGAASLLSPAIINAFQPASGVLATLDFVVHAYGSTTLAFTQLALGGTVSGTLEGPLPGNGINLALDAPSPVIPEPSTALLMGLGLGLLTAGRRLRRS